MRSFYYAVRQMPKWISIIVILAYSFLFSEYSDMLNKLVYVDDSSVEVFGLFAKISYVFTFLSGIITWVIYSIVFHTSALIFGGVGKFKDLAFSTTILYVIPTLMLLIGLFELNDIHMIRSSDALTILKNHPNFIESMKFINYSFVVYYCLTVVIVHFLYNIKWIFAILSVALPILIIWEVSEIIKIL